jgi:hypothetical protein
MHKLKDYDFRIATWNIQTMLQAGKMTEIAEQLAKNKICVSALQEIRFGGYGEIRKTNYSIYYSGASKPGLRGTGFYVDKITRKSVLAFEPINDRICFLRLKGKFQNISMVTCHAPTEESEEQLKDEFYDLLSRTCSKISKHDMFILLGDFNSKLGKEEFIIDVAGKHSLHENTNDNGLRLCNLSAAHGMWISSISFPHKNIHKHTWKIPGSTRANQIDHVIIDKRHASSIIDVRSFRGANCDSDHYLVVAKVRQRLSTINNINTFKKTRWNTDKISENNEERKKYQDQLNEKLRTIENENSLSVPDLWENIQNSVKTVAEDVIGKTTCNSNDQEWYDQECRDATEAKNEAHKRYIDSSTRYNHCEYKNKKKEAKKLHRKKKKKHLNQKVEQIEKHQINQQPKNMYHNIKNQTKNFKPRINICKDKNENLISDRDKIIERWKEHFNELLNKHHSINTINETQEIHTAENLIPEPSIEEVEKAVDKLKNNKSGGEDSITAELLKYGGKEIRNKLHLLITKIWQTESLPNEWLTSLIVPIHKKGDKTSCSNYRGISLLNVVYKIFTNILHERINIVAEEILGDNQCGFRKNRSITDQCFVVSQIFEKFFEFNIDIHCLFIDFKQAFDSLNRQKIYSILQKSGIPKKLIELVKMTLTNTNAKVLIQNETTEPFDIISGVKQGDTLSTLIFNVVLNDAIKEIDPGKTLFTKSIQICTYADDILIMSRRPDDLQEAFRKLERLTRENGLMINPDKTKYMLRTSSTRQAQNLIIDSFNFKAVTKFKYLGLLLSSNNDTSICVHDRIQAANKTYFTHSKLFKSRLLSRNTKLRMYKTLIRPVLTYSCEVWSLKAEDERLMAAFERKILRKIFGPVKNTDGTYRIRYNHELEALINKNNIIRFIKALRIQWLGHVIRLPEERAVKKALLLTPEGNRRRGRPRKRWRDSVEYDLKSMNIRNYINLAMHRTEWRRVVVEAMVHPGL